MFVPRVYFSGWLQKRSEIFHIWRDRFFVLAEKFIFYSSDGPELENAVYGMQGVGDQYRSCVSIFRGGATLAKIIAKPLGVIELENAKVSTCLEKGKFAWKLEYYHDVTDSPKVYYMLCSNLKERDAWLSALSNAIFIQSSFTTPKQPNGFNLRCF